MAAGVGADGGLVGDVQPAGGVEEVRRRQPQQQSVTWFARYGGSTRSVPRTWAEFDTYWDQVLTHQPVRHRTVAYGVGYAVKGWPRPGRVPAPVWAVVRHPLDRVSALITIGGLPPRARELLGLPWSDAQERRHRRLARAVRRLDPVLRRLPRSVTLHPIAAGAFARVSACR